MIVMRRFSILLAVVFCVSMQPKAASAAINAQQRREIEALGASISQAGRLFLQEKFAESGEVVRDVQATWESLTAGGDPDVAAALEPLYNRLLKAHALLELEGVSLPPLKKGKPVKPEPMPSAGDGQPSFSSHVAPILMAKCGRCHVNAARGMVSMANYATLMKGPPAGSIVQAGDPVGSRLVEVIDQGDMPRGGLKVTAEELDTLKKWITAGAKFDGSDPTADLASMSGVEAGELADVQVAKATGNETVSFANDIAPVLAEKCANCHGRGRRPSNGLNLLTFAGLLKGGDSGPPVLPGKPAESLLLKKLRGQAEGEQMPLNQPPLPDDVIAKVETWIKEGATFDGPDENQDVEQVANLAKAERMTHEELSAERMQMAEKNWGLGMAGIDLEQFETEHFLLLGNVGEATLKEYGELAEAAVPQVVELFKPVAGQPLVKGRITLYALAQRYDYTEFGKMVEKRDLPREWRSHWNYSIVDAYGVLIASRSEVESIPSRIARQIVGVYVASLGDLPRWFAEGSARAATARFYPDDTDVKEWDGRVREVVAGMAKATDLLDGKLSPEFAGVASYSFVKLLLTDQKRYQALLGSLRGGQPFEAAFAKAYGGTPEQVAEVWVKRAASGSRRSR